jgi:hypothetical protein
VDRDCDVLEGEAAVRCLERPDDDRDGGNSRKIAV